MVVSDIKDKERYYKALVDKDEQYIGIFYVGVKTTGVFCISTCRARKPKPENVEFFTEVREVLQHGYRPCKVCKPTENAYRPPDDVLLAIEMLKETDGQKITDFEIRQKGISPEKIRRWFKKHYGISFQTYQRMVRINSAFKEIKEGKSVTVSALDSGYESLSGFGYAFKKLIGSSPDESRSKNIILISRLTTPLGPMYACATQNGICLLEFTDRKMLETELKDLQRRLNATILQGENEHTLHLEKELEEYFDGKRQRFDVTLDAPGSAFQRQVWHILQEIPYGETRCYQEQAVRLNMPHSVRAVASANGQNRISIIIPCHRVIGKDGNLTGYGGGLERKKWLLDHERRNLFNNKTQ